MKINLKTFHCTYEFLLRKCSHLPEDIQGKISEDLCLNGVSYDDATVKYNTDLIPETLFDVNFLMLSSLNPDHITKKTELRQDFKTSTKLVFNNEKEENCFFSLFLALFVTFDRKKELHLLYKSNDELSIDCILAWAISIERSNHPFYNKEDVRSVIEILKKRKQIDGE